MSLVTNLLLVFLAGFVTALATGLGAVPFFFVDEVSDRWNVALWGLASGIMLSASTFGLIKEGLAHGTPFEIGVGLTLGVLLVVVSEELLERIDVGSGGGGDGEVAVADGGHDHEHAEHEEQARALVEADRRQLLLILGILTIHSFPEGIAVGVSFAEMGLQGVGPSILGVTIPLLAIFMTVSISIHNVPEGLAISIPLRKFDVSNWRMVGWAIFSSLPQPIGAVVAFYFVLLARSLLPYGFGFAAGAMVWLVVTELVPEGLETGSGLERRGYPEMAAGLLVGIGVMVPLAFL